jgi:hypothetical protein
MSGMSGRAIPKDEVVALLASALGQEKSEEVVAQAARSLALPATAWSGGEVRAIVTKLADAEGLIGVVARFALSRGDVDRLVGPPPHAAEPPAPSSRRPRLHPPPSQRTSEEAPRTGVVDLLPLLAPALGAEKARDAVHAAAARLGLDPGHLTRPQAVTVLEELARSEGIVGVVARFATARFLLLHG